jgi:chromosome partitioning protein
MTIVALTGQKGGSGKTTLAANLAVALAADGSDVGVIDGDPQGSLTTWQRVLDERRGDGGWAGIRIRVFPLGGTALHEKASQVSTVGFNHIVVDTPGRIGDVQREALLLADVALFPVAPSPLEVWALRESIDLAIAAGKRRPVERPLRSALIINRQRPNTAAGKRLRSDMEASAGIPILRTELGDRTAYRDAIGMGEGVTTYAPRSVAAEEVRALVAEVLKLAGHTPPRRTRAPKEARP